MGLYLPPELSWLGYVAGAAWPQGDEDGLWAMGDAWQHAADQVRALIVTVEQAQRDTAAAYPSGTGSDQIAQSFGGLVQGSGSLADLADQFAQVATACTGTGTQLQSTKLTIISSLVMLAYEIIMAWLFPPTAPAVEAGAIGATRLFLQQVVEQTYGRIATWVEQLIDALREFAPFIVRAEQIAGDAKAFVVGSIENAGDRAATAIREAAGEIVADAVSYFPKLAWDRAADTMALSVKQDLAVQLVQIAEGKKKGLDWEELGVSAAASVAGTLAGVPLANIAARGFDRVAVGTFGADVSGGLAGGVRGAFAGSVGGLASGVAGNIVSDLAFTGTLDPSGWGASLVGGVARGAVVGTTKGSVGELGLKAPGEGAARADVNPDDGRTGPTTTRSADGRTTTTVTKTYDDTGAETGRITTSSSADRQGRTTTITTTSGRADAVTTRTTDAVTTRGTDGVTTRGTDAVTTRGTDGVTTTTRAGTTTRTFSDDQGRTITETAAGDGSVTRTTVQPDGTRTSETTRAGTATTSAFDAAGNRVSTTTEQGLMTTTRTGGVAVTRDALGTETTTRTGGVAVTRDALGTETTTDTGGVTSTVRIGSGGDKETTGEHLSHLPEQQDNPVQAHQDNLSHNETQARQSQFRSQQRAAEAQGKRDELGVTQDRASRWQQQRQQGEQQRPNETQEQRDERHNTEREELAQTQRGESEALDRALGRNVQKTLSGESLRARTRMKQHQQSYAEPAGFTAVAAPLSWPGSIGPGAGDGSSPGPGAGGDGPGAGDGSSPGPGAGGDGPGAGDGSSPGPGAGGDGPGAGDGQSQQGHGPDDDQNHGNDGRADLGGAGPDFYRGILQALDNAEQWAATGLGGPRGGPS